VNSQVPFHVYPEEFSWSGSDEGNDIAGRGWAEVHKKEMNGWIYIHLGDDSGFKAKKH
jgi:hypothetical protein